MANNLIWIPKRLVELGLINVAATHAPKFVRYSEQVYDARIANAAKLVLQSNAQVVMLTGPSASGKTTTSHKIAQALNRTGCNCSVVSLDNFYKNIEEYPLLEDGKPDYESVDALDVDNINTALFELVTKKQTYIPEFDFHSEKRGEKKTLLNIGDGIVIVEGIHALNPRLTNTLPVNSTFKIYAGLREEYSLDGQRILPTRDVRLARRMVRDNQFRGHSIEKTISLWANVCAGEDKNIKAFKSEADLLLDTSFSYEVCCLAPHMLNLQKKMNADNMYKNVMNNLCARLALCANISDSEIPKESMLREFLG